ncbi:peptidoglycan DD-metalloendopeptidase family protein [Parapedobacter pyrenivorans]|uniref:peptidoglycan DD-metalloendopeptidase family protein n=1 Tax=Parapedobacter pyrenivorans TaxID=1305674 RepID=UPI00333F8EFE
MKKHLHGMPYALAIISLFVACSDQFTHTLFKGQYPHQRYSKQLDNAGIERTALYRQWQEAAVRSLSDPTAILIPHQETAYMPPDQPTAIGYIFPARQGERLQVEVTTQSIDTVALFIDLFEAPLDTAAKYKHVASADTGTTALTWDFRKDGHYILRIQPELLAEVSFVLRLTGDPSLANPVASAAKQHIGSVFGDARDGGRRKHEGIDIFAARGTPVVAAADGTVGRVGHNRLGGKVVWLRPKGRGINLYYAHLDSQLVAPGQLVVIGDTLGLMGNTGNARTTPPHLHFGIYGIGGAVDPMPFVRPGKSVPPDISANVNRIGDTLRTVQPLFADASRHIPVRVEAATASGYRVVLPDDSRHVLKPGQLVALTDLRSMQLTKPRIVYAQPDTMAARITELGSGQRTDVTAEYKDFLMVEQPLRGWILR